MKIVEGYQQLDQPFEKGTVLTLGNFDGVHLGHQCILKRAATLAKERGLPFVVYTFTPHPQEVLRPDRFSAQDRISTFQERRAKIEAFAPDILIEEPFTKEFSLLSGEPFVRDVLFSRLHTKEIVVGYDVGFGKDRSGNQELLSRLCQSEKIGLTVIGPRKKEEETVSSSRIRSFLVEGQVERVEQLLGAPFSYEGKIIEGDRLGSRTLVATANILIPEKLTLPYGVYITRASIDGKWFASISNVGVRPTVSESKTPVVETHFLGEHFENPIYGKLLLVEFLTFLRPEKKFLDLAFLKKQIQNDIRLANEFHQL